MAVQTRRRHRSLDEFFEAFEGRLAALARTQERLVSMPSGAVELREIVTGELEAAGAELGANFTVDGPVVCLSPRDAQTMGMTVHELTTNAAKYGALRVEKGRIAICWSITSKGGNDHLTFCWREHGVDIKNSAPTRGFGTEIIEKGLAYMLGGSARLTFAPDGADYRLEFPMPLKTSGEHGGPVA